VFELPAAPHRPGRAGFARGDGMNALRPRHPARITLITCALSRRMIEIIDGLSRAPLGF
jgi:hypothetical protein